MNRQSSKTDRASNQLLGEPISAALDIQPGGAQRDAEIAVKAIDSVHTAVGLPRIRIITDRSEAQMGGSLGAYGPVTKEIFVASDGPWPALTTAHEIGHFIDNQGLGGFCAKLCTIYRNKEPRTGIIKAVGNCPCRPGQSDISQAMGR